MSQDEASTLADSIPTPFRAGPALPNLAEGVPWERVASSAPTAPHWRSAAASGYEKGCLTDNYVGNADFPAALTRWKYRAIYHVNDAQVGFGSAEVSVAVGG